MHVCRRYGLIQVQDVLPTFDVAERQLRGSYTVYRVGMKTQSAATVVDISTMRANFCLKLYTADKHENVHSVAKFC